MKKSMKLLLLLNLLLLLVVPTINLQAIEVNWEIGDKYIYHESRYLMSRYTYEDKSSDQTINEFIEDFSINITDINNVSKIINFDRSAHSILSYNYNYSSIEYKAEIDDITDIIAVLPKYDLVNNRTVMKYTEFLHPTWFFIEPAWYRINEAYITALNTSAVIAMIADPYEPITHNITLEDYLGNSTSYTINGIENNLEDAEVTFTADRKQWSFEFDFSNKIYNSYDNGTHTIYFPYEKFIITFDLHYTDEGVLTYNSIDVERIYELEGTKRETVEDYELVLDGYEITDNNSLEYLFIIPTIAIIAVIPLIIKKDKN